MMPPPPPVVVDLDGTLSRSDTLHELIIRLALRRPFRLLGALPSLLRSRAGFKARLGAIRLPAITIPWNEPVLASLQLQDRSFSVCTASNQTTASELCRSVPGAVGVFGSNRDLNLKGERKAAFLRQRFGHHGFVYYGNDRADLPVWREAAKAFVVSDSPRLVQQARRVCPEVEQIPVHKPPRLVSLIRALRPHQWAKNLLVFVPVITSHRFTELPVLGAAIAAVGLFCLLSSGVYVLNDVIDLDADRQHRSKRRRPFAAGDLSVLLALPVFFVLASISLVLAGQLNGQFVAVCGAYLGLAVLYSTWIKKVALLDVYTLAGLYTLRLVAGGTATGIPISVWLAAFSIFIFLSLALCKRYAELLELAPSATAKLHRRGYCASDTAFVLAHGLITMGCATLVLAVYLSSDTVTLLYRTPSLLWFAVLIVSYWGGRLWLLTSRQLMHDDPVLFALKDKVSWFCLFLLVIVFFGAMQLG